MSKRRPPTRSARSTSVDEWLNDVGVDRVDGVLARHYTVTASRPLNL
jgi:hypothetical protein